MSPDGSGDHRFSSLDGISSLSFSADGTKAAVVNYTGLGDRIVLLDLAADTRSVVLPVSQAPTRSLWSVALSPHAAAWCSQTGPSLGISGRSFDGSDLTKLAPGYADADWGSNGRLVASNGIFHGDGERFIATMEPDGGNKTVIATFPPVKESWNSVYELVPSWAPDASAVVFTAQRFNIHPDIWWVGADESNLHRLSKTDAANESGPIFSPDGTEIVFTLLAPNTEADLWLMAPDGTNLTQLTDTAARSEYSIAWQPV